MLLGLRRWSNRVSLAWKLVIVCCLFWFVLLGHRLIFYRIDEEVCSPPSGFYSVFDNYFQALVSAVAPCLVMPILAVLLLRSIRSVVRRRVVPTATMTTPSMMQQMDNRVKISLLLECLIATITYVPYAIELIYSNLTERQLKSPWRVAWENVLVELIHLLSYVFFASSFYTALLSNVGFRRQVFKAINTTKTPVSMMHQTQGTI